MIHPDASGLQPKSDWSRREFVVTLLATGFALAVQPVCAHTQQAAREARRTIQTRRKRVSSRRFAERSIASGTAGCHQGFRERLPAAF
jgi:hypothetical protein